MSRGCASHKFDFEHFTHFMVAWENNSFSCVNKPN
jgi:hypothetical protein